MGKLHSKHDCSLLEERVKRAVAEGDIWKKSSGLDLANYNNMADTLSEISICFETKPGSSPLRVKLPPARGARRLARLDKSGKNKFGLEALEGEDGKQEWSVTYYDLDGRGQVTRQDVATLLKALSGALGPALRLEGARTLTLRLSLARGADGTTFNNDVGVSDCLNKAHKTNQISGVGGSSSSSDAGVADAKLTGSNKNNNNNNNSNSNNDNINNMTISGSRGDDASGDAAAATGVAVQKKKNNRDTAAAVAAAAAAVAIIGGGGGVVPGQMGHHLSQHNNLKRVKCTNERQGRHAVKDEKNCNRPLPGPECPSANNTSGKQGVDEADRQQQQHQRQHHHKRQQHRRRRAWKSCDRRCNVASTTAKAGADEGDDGDVARANDFLLSASLPDDHCEKKLNNIGESRTRRNYYRRLAGVDNTRLERDLYWNFHPELQRSRSHENGEALEFSVKRRTHRSGSAGCRPGYLNPHIKYRKGSKTKGVYASEFARDDSVLIEKLKNPRLSCCDENMQAPASCSTEHTDNSSDLQASRHSTPSDDAYAIIAEKALDKQVLRSRAERRHSRVRLKPAEPDDTKESRQSRGRPPKHQQTEILTRQSLPQNQKLCDKSQQYQHHHLHRRYKHSHQLQGPDHEEEKPLGQFLCEAHFRDGGKSTSFGHARVHSRSRSSRPLSVPGNRLLGPARTVSHHRHETITQAVQYAAECVARDTLVQESLPSLGAELIVQKHEHHHIHEHHHHHHHHHYHHHHRDA